MKLIFSLGLRNLLRQKRRSLLLGIAIGFGMMILVMANSFAHGISDTLLNRMIVYMSGHMEFAVIEKSKIRSLIIRDKDRYIKLIKDNVNGIKEIKENVTTFARLIGNGKGDNAPIVGVIADKEFMDYFKAEVVTGDISNFLNKDIENPVIIYTDKAKTLNVKVNDIIKIRLQTIQGQQQSARLTVAAILKSNNIFEGMVVYVSQADLKKIRGFKEHETGSLQVNFKKINNPIYAKHEADKLHKLLTPGTAVIQGEVSANNIKESASVLGFSDTEESVTLIKENFKFIAGGLPVSYKDEKSCLITAKFADKFYLKPGDKFKLSYKQKFEKEMAEDEYQVSGVFTSDKISSDNVILMRETEFFKTYNEKRPEDSSSYKNAFFPDKKSIIFSVFSPEFKLMARSATSDELMKKLRKMSLTKWKGTNIDVRTMYESASQILDLESALNIITLVAVIVLFFIILIGVINTLRMTIKERTREIGTVRAIGMQSKDVRNSFIIETVLLAAFACLGGIVMAFILMGIMSLFTINTTSIFSILLVERHLHFLPSLTSILGNFLLILGITAITAYFPARKAAKLSAAAALRHYE